MERHAKSYPITHCSFNVQPSVLQANNQILEKCEIHWHYKQANENVCITVRQIKEC